ncbi:MAG: hypothetical protein QW594_03615 [Candidatus Woesearchaeota archaeon]
MEEKKGRNTKSRSSISFIKDKLLLKERTKQTAERKNCGKKTKKDEQEGKYKKSIKQRNYSKQNTKSDNKKEK